MRISYAVFCLKKKRYTFTPVTISILVVCFFYNSPTTTEIYSYFHTLPQHGALPISCLPLREKPERARQVQVGARYPHQSRIGISDEAGQCRHPEPLTYRNDLRLAVRDSEGNPGGANLTLAGPVGDAMNADDDPPDGIRRARAPCGKAIAGDVDAAEQLRPLQAVKIER